MEKCLMEFDSQSKNSSEEALRKWRLAVGGMVKNPRRRFRMVADLVKRKEAEKRLNIQVSGSYGEASVNEKDGDNGGRYWFDVVNEQARQDSEEEDTKGDVTKESGDQPSGSRAEFVVIETMYNRGNPFAEDEHYEKVEWHEVRSSNKVFWKWFIVIFNLLFEILTLAFDQVSSPAKPVFALVGLLLSLVVVAICVIEFSWKAQKAKVIRRQLGRICWFYYPSPSDMLFGNFVEIFGLICAILQVLSSAIQYGFFHRHADNPIKFSLFPVIFAHLCGLFKATQLSQ
ncbi:hypothetical protein L1049_007934 [Liquidambar formosana]|uniref:Calcium-transporting P-type ATPase N-terminal autoinhibitory domain-containing protein n=1 Tax=Liquidambar formosana TaxID=63359 RepID=A0AAP0S8X0_LIQFO